MPAPVAALWAGQARPVLPGADGTPLVLMVATPSSTVRDEARRLVRAALRAYLSPLLGCAPSMVPLHLAPGEAPRIGAPGHALHLSISHEAGLSLAALRSGGRVGVDLMTTADAALPDWQAIAHDFLGPETALRLAALGSQQRPAAFARAWTRHEAALKCLGLQLEEWSPGLQRRLERCRIGELALPAPYSGAVACCE